MAHFDPAATLKREGLYSHDPVDAGGETWRGIARKANPDWPGWAIIDAQKFGGILTADKLRALAADERLNGLVFDLYRERYWKAEYERIESQDVASKVFDLAVNMGPQQAHKLLQRAVRATGRKVDDDGVLGPVTLAAVNEARPDTLLAAFRSEAAGFYRVLVARKPDQERFLAGWLGHRAYGDAD